MPLWNIEFYPIEGNRRSPIDFLKVNCSSNDLALINAKLKSIQDLQRADWPSTWVKQIRKVYQMRQGDFRIYFGVTGRTLVVCHACRKVSQKAKPQDIRTAENNPKSYLAEKSNG